MNEASPLSSAGNFSFRTDNGSHLEIDPDYEDCDAPKFVDFTRDSVLNKRTPSNDVWFERNVETPLANRMNKAESLLLLDHPDMVGGFISPLDSTPGQRDEMAQYVEAITPPSGTQDGELLDDNTPTPKASKMAPERVISVPTPLPAAAKTSSDPGVNGLTMKFTNLRTRPFTPVKRSELYKSTTWADVVNEQEADKAASNKPRAPKTPAPVAKKAQAIVAVAVKKPQSNTAAASSSIVPAVPNFVPTRSTKPLTVPVEFKFATTTRKQPIMSMRSGLTGGTKSAAVSGKVPSNSGKFYSSKLGPTTVKTIAKKPAVTVPKPFRFQSSSAASAQQSKQSAEAGSDASPFVPLAVRVKEFTKTPERFKKTAAAPKPVLPARKAPILTQPKTPKFATDQRLKKEKPMTTEEMIMQKIRPFRARPIDMRVLNSAGDFGVPRVRKAALTVAQSPPITKPIAKVPVEKPESPVRIIKANPYVPAKPFQPKIEHRVIEVPEFRLPGDEISRRKKEQLEEEVRHKEEEERRLREFHAHPIHSDFVHSFPAVANMRDLTQPMSPALTTKQRGQYHRAVLEERIERERIEHKLKSQFHAQPIPHSHDIPYQPQLPEHHPKSVENEPPLLNTEVRAAERRKFDEEMRLREEYMERLKRQEIEETERRAEEERRLLRRQAEFHARPVRSALPFEPKKSDKPLTEPISPFIGEKRRQLMKQ